VVNRPRGARESVLNLREVGKVHGPIRVSVDVAAPIERWAAGRSEETLCEGRDVPKGDSAVFVAVARDKRESEAAGDDVAPPAQLRHTRLADGAGQLQSPARASHGRAAGEGSTGNIACGARGWIGRTTPRIPLLTRSAHLSHMH